MPTIILTILFGLIIAFFATQNTEAVSLKILTYTLPAIPLYMVIIGTLVMGMFFSWMIGFINSIATDFTLWGKDNKIKDVRKENALLTKRIHELEIENAKVTTEKRMTPQKSA